MATYTGTVTTNTAPLRIRAGTSTSTSIQGRIPKGAKVTITEVIDKGNGWKWGKVTYNGVSGYCCINEPGVGQWIKLDTKDNKTTPKQNPKTASTKPSSIANKIKNTPPQTQVTNKTGNILQKESTQSINGSAVQYAAGKYAASGYNDVDSVSMADPITGLYRAGKDTNENNEPRFIQNASHFPPVVGTSPNGNYEYDYYMDYSDMKKDFDAIYNNSVLGLRSRRENFIASAKYYNRFKLPTIENVLARSYAHVFFIRPDLNILEPKGQGIYDLASNVKNDSNFYWAKEHSLEVMKDLIHDSYDHDFAFLLSNAVRSFELSDQYIKSDTYGDAYTGHKIAYGRHDIESKTSGTFNITFAEDRDIHITTLHHLWTQYISGVYRGRFKAKDAYIRKKILDYATAVYYILTAEDGETIIFWSKYYGVFPTNIPSSQFSYSKGTLLSNPEISISYAYSFKEDYNPLSLVEFNMNSPKQSLYKYRRSYNAELLGTGKTFVGAPFIETFRDGLNDPYTFKLRFR